MKTSFKLKSLIVNLEMFHILYFIGIIGGFISLNMLLSSKVWSSINLGFFFVSIAILWVAVFFESLES